MEWTRMGRGVAWVGLALTAAVGSGAGAPAEPNETAVVALETTAGDIRITVDLERAPVSAGDFLRYVDQELYDGAAFYRVVREDNDHGTPPIQVVQGGIPDEERALEPVAHETTEETGITHGDGVISLARGEPGTGGGAAFFICIRDQPALDFGGMRNADGLGFAAFGRVTSGMDVVRRIHGMPTSDEAPVPYLEGQLLAEPVTIVRARRVSSAEHPTDDEEAAAAAHPAELPVERLARHLDAAAREPMVVEHPSGALFVSGYPRQDPRKSVPRMSPNLWRSDDGGATWRRVHVGTPEDGAIGNSDVDLAVGPEGALYFAVMGFDRATGKGTHVAVGTSRDAGASWTWTRLTDRELADRPWVRVAPDGAAHAIWNDGDGVAYAVSTDRGRTWVHRERIAAKGGSSHLAIGPAGELAVRISPLSASANRFDAGADHVAVSLDGGRTWALHAPPGERTWPSSMAELGTHPRWVEPLAWDAAGRLLHLWGEGETLWLGRSEDHGETWQSWPVATGARPFFPYLAACGGPAPRLLASWFEGSGDDLRARFATIGLGDEGPPTVTSSQPLALEIFWTRDRGETASRDTGGEYLPVTCLASGAAIAVTPVQDPAGDRWGFDVWRLEAP